MRPVTRTVTLTLLGLALAATACRGGGGNGDDTGDDDPDAANTDDVSIYDIQQGEIAVGTTVDVRGVVVTAIDNYGERKGNIWVAEPDGGAYSGVLVFGIELSAVADLAVGDLVDLESVVVDEFALTEDTSGRTTTELTPPEGGAITVTKVGDGTVPAPEVVDALAIGMMSDEAARDAEWEKWEGVLITLENVSVLSELDQIGSTPQDPPFEEIRVTGPMRADTSLSSISPVTLGDCLASVTGIGDYFFNYKILPRSTDDIVGGGTACPAEETGATACGDEVDNDANGFADCADNNCASVAECTTDTTVTMIQMGMVDVDSNVNLTNLVVTAVDDIGTTNNPDSNKGFWAADAAQGAAYNGIYVYTNTAVPAGVVIGATVNVSGQYTEFDLGTGGNPPVGDTLSEIEADVANVTVLVPTATPAPLTGIALDTLKDISNGEQYEGVLVQIANVELTATASGDRLTFTDTNGQTIVVDDDAFNYAAADFTIGTCYATVTGVMSLNIFDDERRLMPRDADDLVTGGTCD